MSRVPVIAARPGGPGLHDWTWRWLDQVGHDDEGLDVNFEWRAWEIDPARRQEQQLDLRRIDGVQEAYVPAGPFQPGL